MYQVWTKEGYEETWHLTDCPDIASVEQVIRDNFGKEVEVRVSMPVEFDAKITVKIHAPEEKISATEKYKLGIEGSKKEERIETTQSEAEPGKGTGGKGHSKVR